MEADGLVAHRLTLGQISSRNPESRQNRLRSRVRSTKKSLSRNSETKHTLRASKEEPPAQRPRRPLWGHATTANTAAHAKQIKESYQELELGAVRRDDHNLELLEWLKPSDFGELARAKRRVFRKILSHIVKRRLIRDEQFDQLYLDIVGRHPAYEREVRDIMVEVVSSLDL